MRKDRVKRHFISFSEKECKNSSPLYEFLSKEVAGDEEIIEISMEAGEGQPTPNLLFGAVHYLLLKGTDHQLAQYYPSVVDQPKAPSESFSDFKDFVLTYQESIIDLLKTRLVQTNEVRRCAYLFPVFCYAYEQINKPLSMIEIGTSAGLQLNWDQYSYSYGTNEIFGKSNSSVNLTAEIRGENQPSLHQQSPPVVHKVGLDLHTVNLKNDDDYLWLKALIWPEHSERLKTFEHAAEQFRNNPVQLIEGDGVELLSREAERTPADSAICVFHTHVANQMPKESKEKLIEQIRTIGKTRDIFHIYNNMSDTFLHIDYFINGKEYQNIVAETDGHGRWFTWEIG